MTAPDPALESLPPPAARRSGVFLPLLLLVLCAALAAAGFYLWREHRARDVQLLELSQQVEQNRAQLAQLQQTLNDELEQRLAATESQLADSRRQLEEQVQGLRDGAVQLQQRLDDHQQRLRELASNSRADWLLAEAEYLLKIANQRVLIEGDTRNAAALLQSADQLVQQAAAGGTDAELFAVRKAIGRDRLALENITPVDREGIYLRLYALAQTLDDLPRVESSRFLEAPSKATPTKATPAKAPPENAAPGAPAEAAPVKEGWGARIWRELREMAAALGSYIRIDDVKAPAKPLVDSYLVQVAGLNLRLLLEQAQLAVLKADGTVYKHSLEEAQKLLDTYYLASDPARQLRAQLAELAAVEVAPALPDISEAPRLLQDYLRRPPTGARP